MVRKKGINKGRNDSDSDSGDGVTDKSGIKAQTDPGGEEGLSRKQKRVNKLANKSKEKTSAQQKIQQTDDVEEQDDEDTESGQIGKTNKKLTKKQQRKNIVELSSEDDEEQEEKRQPKKQPKQNASKLKEQYKKQLVEIEDEDEMEEEEQEEEKRQKKKQPKKKASKLKEQHKKQLTVESEDEDAKDEEEDEEEKKQSKKRVTKLKNQHKKQAVVESEDEEEKEEEEQEKVEEDPRLKSKFEGLVLDDSEDEDQRKSRKNKKEKKEKTVEKGLENSNKQDQSGEKESPVYVTTSKFESNGVSLDNSGNEEGKNLIEYEKKKEGGKVFPSPSSNSIFVSPSLINKERKKDKTDKKNTKKKQIFSDDVDDKNKCDNLDVNKGIEDEEEEGIMYGAPDDIVWTDKSYAQIETEKLGEKADDDFPTYGADGKKLSNKERKKMKKESEARERMEEFEKAAAKASKEGAQFACSQTAVDINDPHWCNSLDINIPSFNISAAGKVLFKDASLNIPAGRRIGFVAPNGRGKSTLLKMIASKDLLLPPKIDFLYVEQEVAADQTPAVEAVLMADKKRWNLLEEEKMLTAAIDAGNEDPANILRLQQVLEDLNVMGSDAAEAKARRILYGLGFDGEMQTKATKLFSGGWRMRISLARALFMEPTLLMPTNHLDLNAVIWLDDYLQRWKKTLLIVSHDQDFLNSVCQEIMHIEDLKVVSYKGNYDTFKQMEATKMKQQQKEWEKQEKRLRELKRSGQSRTKATETLIKGTREPGARASKKKQDAAIATGTTSVVAKELIKRPREYVVKLEFAEVPEIARPIIEVHNVNFRYSPKHPVIFDNVDFGIDLDSRICIVGPNGAGKSTLLKLLIGELEPTTGGVRRNPRLRMGVYQQHFVDRLPMDKTAVQHLRDRFQDEDYQSVRNRLGKYGLEGHAHEVNMRDLSGGQKARVVFVELSLQKPHVLLLEPTNNLDIETIDALIDAINEFHGGIIVVTHDARLIEQCNCTLWVVEKQGVTQWQKGFDDYKSTLLREMEEKMASESESRRAKLEAAATARSEKLKEKLVRLDAAKRREVE